MSSPKQHTTAILVFANSSQEELRHKPIVKGGALFDELTRHTLQIVKNTKIPYFHFTEAVQRGNSFGERFTNAIQEVFDQGFDQIITIGNDTPQLRVSHILRTYHNLLDQKSVLGPSADGGIYLMGLHRSQFVPSELKKLPWQTSSLALKLSKLIRNYQELVLLPVFFDIDTIWDLKILANSPHSLTNPILKVILSLISSVNTAFRYVYGILNSVFTEIIHNKGSPILLRS